MNWLDGPIQRFTPRQRRIRDGKGRFAILVCTHGHARCSEMLPNEDCPHCERKVRKRPLINAHD